MHIESCLEHIADLVIGEMCEFVWRSVHDDVVIYGDTCILGDFN